MIPASSVASVNRDECITSWPSAVCAGNLPIVNEQRRPDLSTHLSRLLGDSVAPQQNRAGHRGHCGGGSDGAAAIAQQNKQSD